MPMLTVSLARLASGYGPTNSSCQVHVIACESEELVMGVVLCSILPQRKDHTHSKKTLADAFQ